jgi:hypothetical protein
MGCRTVALYGVFIGEASVQDLHGPGCTTPPRGFYNRGLVTCTRLWSGGAWRRYHCGSNLALVLSVIRSISESALEPGSQC